MYIHTHQDIRCSKCNTLNYSEMVTRGDFGHSETVRRCRSCGHEKVLSTTSSNSIHNQQPISYKLPPQEKETKF